MKSTLPSSSCDGEERAAGFIVFRLEDGIRLYLLLRHRHDGRWAFPKGRLEHGELERDAAMRETVEETGIECLQPCAGFRQLSNYCFHRDGRRIAKSVAYFVAETRQSQVTLSDEHVEYAWRPFETAVDTLMYDESRRVLAAAECFLSPGHEFEERGEGSSCTRS
jgi:bis(5'-nucleosidyl)-tetraphosphatase